MFLCFQCNVVCSYVGRFFSLCAILVKTYDASAECFHCYIAKCNISRSKITAVSLNTPDIKIASFLDHCNISVIADIDSISSSCGSIDFNNHGNRIFRNVCRTSRFSRFFQLFQKFCFLFFCKLRKSLFYSRSRCCQVFF